MNELKLDALYMVYPGLHRFKPLELPETAINSIAGTPVICGWR